MSENFDKLVEIIKTLRDPVKGCPWDIKQTHESLKRYAIEEVYEVIDAIDSKKNLAEELGDLLLQVLLHSQIAEDNNEFNIEQVVSKLNSKLIERHPHVFGDIKISDADEVLKNWNAIKEKKETPKILNSLPALIKVKKLSSLTNKKPINFGSDEIGLLCEKLYEASIQGHDLEIEVSKRIIEAHEKLTSKE